MSVIDKFLKKAPHQSFCSAVILAAGTSQRMGADKIMLELQGEPVIARTLRAFDASDSVDEIVVVTRLERLQQISDLCIEYGIRKVSRVVCGGKTRAQSALAGVLQTSENADIIAVHDGARPFVSQTLIERTAAAARESGAAAPALSATDTVRILNKKGAVVSTPDRSLVALVQTPQIFEAELIRTALKKAVDSDAQITDDCSAVEAVGNKVTLIDGERDNIKLTTARDIAVAEQILKDRSR